jgi:hypothetical protein
MPDMGVGEAALALGGGQILGGILGGQAAQGAANTQANAANNATAAQMAMFNRVNSGLAPWANQGKMSLAALSGGLGFDNSQETPFRVYSGQTYNNRGELRKALEDDYTRQHGGIDPAGQQAIDGVFRDIMAGSEPVATDQQKNQLSAAGITPGMFTEKYKDYKPFSLSDFNESPAYQFNLEQGQKALDKAANARKMLYAPATLKDLSRFSQGLASNEFQNAYNNYNNDYQTGFNSFNNARDRIWNRLFSVSGSGQNAAAQQGAFGMNTANQVGNNITSAGAAQAAGQVGQANAFNNTIGGLTNLYTTQQMLSSLQAPAYNRPGADPNFPGDAGMSLARERTMVM